MENRTCPCHIPLCLPWRGCLIHTCVPFLARLIPYILLGAALVPFPHHVYSDAVRSLCFLSETPQDSQHPPQRFLQKTIMQSLLQCVTKRNKCRHCCCLERGFTKGPESLLRLCLLLGVPDILPCSHPHFWPQEFTKCFYILLSFDSKISPQRQVFNSFYSWERKTHKSYETWPQFNSCFKVHTFSPFWFSSEQKPFPFSCLIYIMQAKISKDNLTKKNVKLTCKYVTKI